ncbi:hypothetical protein [Marinobacter salarius]|uniref:hypothetical protein n=1 Tax=Marinobacter salarius TaxID=1420917 RepID=UPI003BAA4D47
MPPSNSTIIRYLSGEGNFAVLKNKGLFQRIIFSTKLIIKVFLLTFPYSKFAPKGDLVYVCGSNQHRLLGSIDLSVYDVDENYCALVQPTPFSKEKDRSKNKIHVSIAFKDFFVLFFYCLGYIVLGKNKLLAAFFIKYYNCVSDFFRENLHSINRLICFNDQPFECASLILAAKSHKKSSVVIQHGVIISYDYYFPINCDEFWAWGSAGRPYFKSRSVCGEYIVKGRWLKKKEAISSDFVFPDSGKPKGVICPSFFWKEIFFFIRFLKALKEKGVKVDLKLHPATKFKILIKFLMITSRCKWVKPEVSIQLVAKEYDFLITRNSSSALDFLLLGKPVFGVGTSDRDNRVFGQSFFDENGIDNFVFKGELNHAREVNDNRLSFLAKCVGDY